MKIEELRTFLTIVETSSLVRASAVLNVTQSTVTARLKSLEQEVGQSLIVRNKSGATVTAAGERLIRYADTITELWRQVRQETALPDGMSGICNIACDHDLWPGLGVRFFDTLKSNHPEIAISVWLGSQSDVATWLNEGKSDVALTYGSAVSKRQQQGQIELPKDTLALVSSKPVEKFAFDASYVFVEAGVAFGRAHATAFADAGSAAIRFGNASLGLEHLLRIGGSAYLPLRIAGAAIKDGQLFRVAAMPEFSRDVFLTYNQSARVSWGWFEGMVHSLQEPSVN